MEVEVALPEAEVEIKAVETKVPIEVKEPAVKKVGTTQRINVDFAALEANEAAQTEDTNEEEAVAETQPETKAEDNKEVEVKEPIVAETPKQATSEITDDILKEYFKKNGIDFESTDKLKERLTPKEEITPEEERRRMLNTEKRYVDKWVEGGGTVEQYVALKETANKPLKDLSLDVVTNEYKKMGFSDEEIPQLIKDHYYQVPDEEIEDLDEDGKEYTKKLKNAFTPKLENKASYIQKQAKDILAGLAKHIEEEDLQGENEKVLSSKIDDIFKKAPRKVTFEIGESNGKVIPPIDFEVSESDIDDTKSLFKDKGKREKLLFNEDGSPNITNISNLHLRNKYLEKAVKFAYLSADDRAAKLIEQRFPSKSPFEVGIGGSSDKNGFSKGKISKIGKTVRV